MSQHRPGEQPRRDEARRAAVGQPVRRQHRQRVGLEHGRAVAEDGRARIAGRDLGHQVLAHPGRQPDRVEPGVLGPQPPRPRRHPAPARDDGGDVAGGGLIAQGGHRAVGPEAALATGRGRDLVARARGLVLAVDPRPLGGEHRPQRPVRAQVERADGRDLTDQQLRPVERPAHAVALPQLAVHAGAGTWGAGRAGSGRRSGSRCGARPGSRAGAPGSTSISGCSSPMLPMTRG